MPMFLTAHPVVVNTLPLWVVYNGHEVVTHTGTDKAILFASTWGIDDFIQEAKALGLDVTRGYYTPTLCAPGSYYIGDTEEGDLGPVLF